MGLGYRLRSLATPWKSVVLMCRKLARSNLDCVVSLPLRCFRYEPDSRGLLVHLL